VSHLSRRITERDVLMSLWGVVLAFLVQIMYDGFGDPLYTSIMPKVWWGFILAIGLTILLFVLMRKIIR
jgi:uncharacterized membrane protein (DUF4010 family)